MSMIRSLLRPRPAERAMTIDDVADVMRAGGYVWGGGWTTTYPGNPEEQIPGDFQNLVLGLYRANPIVFAAVVTRMQIFAQARFRFRQINNGEPGKAFGKPSLALIEQPEPTLSTPDMLKRASLDADFAGNWFGIKRPERIKRVRPDWVYIVKASRNPAGEIDDVDTEVVGIVYQNGGIYSDHQPESFAVGEYAHYAPIPDPLASYRGMSWMTPIIQEVQADKLMTTHKRSFLEHAATPNILVKFPPALGRDKAVEFQELFEQEHEGAWNAYRTVFLGGGADLSVIGTNMQQMDFKSVQGAGETRIAMASRVPAVLLQISEGLQGSSLNTGNYAAAKKQFADSTMRDLWQTMAGSLADIVVPPPGSELWYDEARIPFLAEDAEAAANVLNLKSTAMRTLWDGGADPDSAIEAINTGDLTRLKHTGAQSVQVQPGAPADGSTDQTPAPPDQQQALAAGFLALASGLLGFDPHQPRRPDGRWGGGGGGGSHPVGGGRTIDIDQIVHGPAVPVRDWGKGPTVAPAEAFDELLHGKSSNVKPGDIAATLEVAASEADKYEKGTPERARIDAADLTDLQVAGTLDFGGDGLGIRRKDMPQFSDTSGKSYLPEYLDHCTKENGWKVSQHVEQDPKDLHPSQSEVSAAKVGGMVRSTKAGTMKRAAEVVVSEDDFVIDGHHGWGVATAMAYENPKTRITTTIIHAPAHAVLKDAIDWTDKRGIARQDITTGPDQKKAAVDKAFELWALRHPAAPVPLAEMLAMTTNVRCANGHLVGESLTPPYSLKCRVCKEPVVAAGRWVPTADPKVVIFSRS